MKYLLYIVCICCFATITLAQTKYPLDSSLFVNYKYRSIGPYRGGRASAVCGDTKNKNLFYMASTGGGVWKTTDAGNNWSNISDKYFGGSIGCIEVAPSDPLVLYVGTGETTLRGNVSEGNGMYKSTDGGKTWKHIGLKDTRHIMRIVIHPKNSDIVYACASGHLFGKNAERGVFKTIDGGTTWTKVLYINDEVGAADIQMDNSNPAILYASTWRVKRTGYSMESGGDGSALWKTTDAGNTWKNISKNKGLPKDTLGMICIAIAPTNTDIVYAMIENKNAGGLYRSDNAGETWTKQNEESSIRQRAWYFSRIYVDTKNENKLYVCNVELHKSTDAGKTYSTISTPHGDHHGMWIDTDNPDRMIIADDGGAQISMDGGNNWSTYYNQPTAQFYRVTSDNHFPYRIYGCQQDNSSVRILSRTYDGSINNQDWTSSAGFESGHIVADPLNSDIVYGGNYGGYISRLNHITGENRTVSVYPESPIGSGADTLKYRFQWNFPIFFSPHNPKRMYAAGNHLFYTENEGQSWTKISPDLTTNDKTKQQESGGIITKDNTGVEYYCTVFAAAESPVQKDVLWCGSDDGLLHITKDGGTTWEKVNAPTMPEWLMFNCIEPSKYDAGTCYIAATKYKYDDTKPYLYKTTDYGKTWKLITTGIPATNFTRCIREDNTKKGILYCGTEQGMYVSFNDGDTWASLQLNLPIVPITDICLKNNDIIVATQGRSFWILDNVCLLHQLQQCNTAKNIQVFTPDVTYRMQGYQKENIKAEGTNPPNGVVFNYWIKNYKDSEKVELSIFDKNNKLIKTYSTKNTKKEDNLVIENGMNTFVWNMYMKGVEKIDGMVLWNGNIESYKIPPGKYKATMMYGNESSTVDVTILKDPNYTISDTEYEQQYTFLKQVRDKFNETQNTIKDIRSIRNQISGLKEKLATNYPKDLDSLGKNIIKETTAIEEALFQTKAKSGQDVLNYPIRLNDKLAAVFDAANQNTAPSAQVQEVYTDIATKIDAEIHKFKNIIDIDVKKYNRLVKEKEIGYILLKTEE